MTGDDVVVVERMQEVETLGLERLDHREQPGHLGRESDLAAVASSGRDLRLRRGFGHHDGHVHALGAPGVRDGLGGVPRAHGDDAGAAGRRREPRHRVDRAADLERAGPLEVLELQERLGTDPVPEGVARDQRCAQDVAGDRGAGALGVSEPDGHRMPLLASPSRRRGPARIRTWDQQIMSPPLWTTELRARHGPDRTFCPVGPRRMTR